MWHGYFGIENLALNDSQRDTLVTALRALGPAASWAESANECRAYLALYAHLWETDTP